MYLILFSKTNTPQNEEIEEEVNNFDKILFCTKLRDFISMSMTYENELEVAHIKMKEYAEENFSNLSFGVMNHIKVKQYIVNNVIRKCWHQSLEEFYAIITSPISKEDREILSNKLKSFQLKFSNFCNNNKNMNFSKTRAGEILTLQIRNLRNDMYSTKQLNKTIASVRRHLYRLYDDNILYVLFEKPKKLNKKK
jgi:hypothetical protein